MDLKVNYSRKAIKFLTKNKGVLNEEKCDDFVRRAARTIILKENNNIDLKPLKGSYLGMFRIRFRNIRIIFRIIVNEWLVLAEVDNVGFKGSVYKK